MMTEQTLIAKGYAKYKSNEVLHPNALFMYQKAFYRNNVKAYFITIEIYPIIHKDQREELINEIDPEKKYAISPESQMETVNGHVFNISLLCSVETIDDIEDFFSTVFDNLNCKNYDG